MKSITILGGGISGLTAAIHLKAAGVEVEIHERKRFCGKRTHDFQFLENWVFEEDALVILQGLNIQTDFYIKPWHSMEYISPSSNKCLKRASAPLMYLVKRGPLEDSIDYALQKQALSAGIPIHFNSALKTEEADIIATGLKEPTVIVMGITFPFDHSDTALTVFDDDLSHKFYSYLIVNDNVGEIASINPTARKDHKVRLDLTIKRFEELLDFKINTVSHRFAASSSLFYLSKAKINNQYRIGEAAGFQDCLAGFGMMYAFKSGYCAARSIIENSDFDRLWQTEMLKPLKISRANRLLFEKLSNEGYEKVVDMLGSRNAAIVKLLGGDDFKLVLNKLYNHSISHLLRPIIFQRKLTPIFRLLLRFIGWIFFT
jgi:flavin-dependent dehydrogenase